MSEYEELWENRAVRQGDVFEWVGASLAAPWFRYGVVVTADCDLAKSKVGGRVSYVPALSAEDYIWHFWKDRKFGRTYEAALETLCKRTTKLLRRSNPQQNDLSAAAMLFWIETAAGRLTDEVGLADPGEITTFLSLVDNVNLLKQLLESQQPDLALLRRCYEIHSKKVGGASDDALTTDFQSSVSKLPGDVFHLPTLEDREEGGIFLMLRYISQCNLDDIATRPIELKLGNAKAKRIGRIAAPYRYAMTQNLGRVFSDIGLPDEYDARRHQSSTSFFQSRSGR